MFYPEEKNNIKYFKSDIFGNGLIHALSTRIGGNTPYPLNSFSLGTAGLAELKPYVETNKERLCSILGLNHKNIISPEQKHTNNIKIVTSIEDNVSDTDGIITAVPELVVMLLFADCIPVILFSPKNKVLGVIHAGWRGTAKKIVLKGVKIFTDNFNIYPEEIKAAIGPAIGQCCYPVSIDVASELKMSINDDYDKIFINDKNTDKVKIDLKKLNARQLMEIGVKNIDILDYCTSCHNSLFYSYRADNGKTGRHCAIASIPPN